MSALMTLVNKLRALLVLVSAPFLTVLFSLLVLLFWVLRFSPKQLKVFPRSWARSITWLSGVKVKVEGMEKLDHNRPYIFAANHQSQFDIFALDGHFIFDFRWVAKKELFRIPFFGTAMQVAGTVSIDRSRGRQAMKSLAEAAKRIADGTSVVIFPEGTRSKDGKLQAFKAGAMHLAIKSGVEIVPMAILGTHEILPKGKILAKPGKVTIRIGDPVPTSSYEVKQKQELAELLHDKVGGLLER